MGADQATQTTQAVMNWVELLKLGIFAIFVTSIIEVVKAISAKGIWGIISEVSSSLIKNTKITGESAMSLSFVIALICIWAFDYGVIKKFIEPGAHVKGSLASWIDYVGTASLIYMGADALFKKFAAVRSGWMAAAAPTPGAAAPGILKDDTPGPGDKK